MDVETTGHQQITPRIYPDILRSKIKKYNCLKCKDTGWQLYCVEPSLLEYVYGIDAPTMVTEYAKRCDCSGKQVNGEDLTGVPEALRFVDISKFHYSLYDAETANLQKIISSFVYDFHKWSDEGKGLYLWSNTPGSGKTFLASCIGKSVMTARDKIFKFITAPEYIAKVGDSYKRDRGEADASLIYRKCDLLVLDDIGAQMGKEWQQQELFRLVDERMKSGLVTIYTSNSEVNKLNVDERTKSRIMSTTINIHMPEESIRAKQAQNEQGLFLSKIFK